MALKKQIPSASPKPWKTALAAFFGIFLLFSAGLCGLYLHLRNNFNVFARQYTAEVNNAIQPFAQELPFTLDPGTPAHQRAHIEFKQFIKNQPNIDRSLLIELSNNQPRTILDTLSAIPTPRAEGFRATINLPPQLLVELKPTLNSLQPNLVPKTVSDRWWEIPTEYYLITPVNRPAQTLVLTELNLSAYGKPLNTLQALIPWIGIGVISTALLVALVIGGLSSKWKTATQQYKQAAEFQKHLLYSFPSPVCFLDTQGKIVFFNNALPKLFGLSYDLIVKRQFTSILAVDLLGGAVQTCTHTIPSGESKHILVHLTKITQGQQPGTIVNLVDLSELHNAQKSAFLTSNCLEHSDTGIVIIDHTYQLVWANNQFFNFINVDAPSSHGPKDIFTLLAQFSTPSNTDLKKILTQSTAWTGNLSASNREAHCSINPVQFENELYFVLALTDISELRKKEQQLMQVNKQLEDKTDHANNMALLAEKSAASKAQFLAIMSHEIRTPLNGIIGYSDLMKDTEMTPSQVDLVKNLTTCSKNLHSLINDILDYSKYEAGKVEPEYTNFDLIGVCYEAIAVQMPKAESKRVQINLNHSPGFPNMVSSDQLRLNQVMNNLLSNAIKFTPQKGSITVNLDLVDNKLSLSVEDTGPGIAPENLEKIFQPFTQEDASTTRKYGGTGLGLSICRQIIESLGGNITVSNRVPNGAKFQVSLPMQIASNNTQSPFLVKKVEWNAAAWVGRKILVMEDHPTNLLLMEKYLAKLGLKADFCEDGESGVAQAQKVKYDVIILDMLMPKMNGLEAIKRIRSNTTSKEAQAILLTANTNLKGSNPTEMGFNAFIAKPYAFDELRNVLVKLQNSFAKNN